MALPVVSFHWRTFSGEGEVGTDIPGVSVRALDECVANAARPLGRYDMVSHVYSSFLQMLLRERLQALAPKHVGYFVTLPSETGVVSPTGTKNVYKAHALPWTGIKQSSG